MNKNTFIFDMDGVIIDSEPFWRQAQIKVISKYGHTITAEDCIRLTMGKRLDDICITWCELFSLPVSPDALKKSILKSLLALINEYGAAKEGLLNLLNYLVKEGFQIALATSSSHAVINSVIDRLSIRSYFDFIGSADDEEFGKPHPAIYIRAANSLKVKNKDCIVLEDSVTGMIAGKAAEMTTLVVPENREDKRFWLADGIFYSMNEVLEYLSSTKL